MRHLVRHVVPVPCFERTALRGLEFNESDAFLLSLGELVHAILRELGWLVGVLCLVLSRTDNDVAYQVFARLELERARKRLSFHAFCFCFHCRSRVS